MSRPSLLRTTVFRLALCFAGIFVVVLGGVLTYSYWSMGHHADELTDATLVSEVRDLRGIFTVQGPRSLAEEIDERVNDYARAGLNYLLRARDGTKLAGDLPASVAGPSLDAAATRELPTTVAEEAPGTAGVRLVATALPGGYTLVVAHRLHVERAILSHALDVYLVSSALASGAILVAGAMLGRRVVRRIDDVSRTAAHIVAGDLSQRLPVRREGDEFGDLAAIVNRMLDRIERLIASMTEVSDNVAHDLRSPLTRLRSNLEIALLQHRTGAEYRTAIEAAIADSDEILRTFNALLSIARAEAGPPDDAMPEVDLVSVASDTVEIYEAAAAERGIELTLKRATPSLVTRADEQLVAQALCNLVDNAVKHGPRGEPVVVVAARGNGHAILEVRDRGPGIPADQRARVVQRFVRLDASRRLPGNGLGLSLVEAVATYHQGRLRLEDNRPGLRAILELAGPPVRPARRGARDGARRRALVPG